MLGTPEISHFGQTYNDEVPYTYHLDQVHSVLVRFGVRDIVFLVGGLLHAVKTHTT